MQDIFHKDYIQLKNDQLKEIEAIKNAASELAQLIPEDYSGTKKKCTENAMQHLEECVMWAVKGITS